MSLSTLVAKAPDFWLPDQEGRLFHLYEHLMPGGTVLVFYRGHWCPYCRRYLGKLRDVMPRLTDRGAGIVAVSPEPAEHSQALVKDLELTFPLLSDLDGIAIDAYGTRNGFTQGAAGFARRSLIPHPAVFVVSSAGEIRFRALDRNYKKRTTMRTILGEIDSLTPTHRGA